MPPRYLQRNDGTEVPSNLVFFDTESFSEPCPNYPDKLRLRLRLWAAIHCELRQGKITRRKVYDGDDSDSFWEFMLSALKERKRTWAFAHNAAFDLTQLRFWEQLDAEVFTIKPLFRRPNKTDGKSAVSWIGKICAESRPFYVVCRHERKTLTINDTGNYWPKSLASIGDDLQLPKLPLPDDSAGRGEWLQYCIRDCEIIESAMCDLLVTWATEKCGVFQLTAPALAMTNFRHTCEVMTPNGKAVDILCKPDSKEHELERESYFGGRTWCLYVGEINDTVYHVDVNSLYPYVMREHSYPRAYLGFRREVPTDELRDATEVYGIVADVTIDSRTETFPIRIEGLQYHCSGRFRAVLCGPELRRAIDTRSVSRCHIAQYYSIAPLFRTWVNYWYSRKLESSPQMGGRRSDYEFSKLVLNSLYGKWAQRGRHWRDEHDTIPLMRWGGWSEAQLGAGKIEQWRGIAGNAQRLTTDSEPAHAFPLISAYITSYAREYMLSAIEVCGYDNVYYLATDALFVNQLGFDNLYDAGFCDETQIGRFKVVAKANYLRIGGANHYTFGDKCVASGLAGLCIKAKEKGTEPYVFEQVGAIISHEPNGEVVIERAQPPTIAPDYRGVIGKDGRWSAYRVTADPDWTDRPSRSRWVVADWPDTGVLRIRPDV